MYLIPTLKPTEACVVTYQGPTIRRPGISPALNLHNLPKTKMLPTPCTSHVSFDTIYEPSEDSYLFLDTLSSTSESAWLSQRFTSGPSGGTTPTPLVVEVGTGSGVVLAFAAANSGLIFGRRDVLTLGVDVNRDACLATRGTVVKAVTERQSEVESDQDTGMTAKTQYIASITADLTTSLRPGSVDVLLFNPPYVPTEELPEMPYLGREERSKFDEESYLLSLTYAGGMDGMETTQRLLDAIPGILHPTRGVAYVLLCKQNHPEEVKQGIRNWGNGWQAETVGNSGKQAGWEKLVIVRIWRS